MPNYILVVGNAIDGLTFYGPADDASALGDWAADEFRGEEWHVVNLQRADMGDE